MKGSSLKYFIEQTINDGSYLWSIPENVEAGTDWRIKISDSFDSNTYDESNYFQITVNSISVTAPTEEETFAVGETYAIIWTTTGTIDYITIELYEGILLIEPLYLKLKTVVHLTG